MDKDMISPLSEEEVENLVRDLDLHNAVFEFQKSAFLYQHEKGDIFLLSYPKCGSNWLQHMFWSLLNQGESLPPNVRINELCPWLEFVGEERTKATPTPRLIKSHLSLKYLRYSPDAKYIYLVRNPKDVLISFWHHHIGMGILTEDLFEQFYESFLNGTVRWGSYFEHLQDILKEIPEKDNILMLRYEDLKNDTAGSLRKVLEFVEVRNLPGLEDGSLIDKVLRNTSVASMQKNQERWLLHEGQWKREDFTFVRQGKAKNWREFLSESQSDRLTEKFRTCFTGTMVEHWWDGEMKK